MPSVGSADAARGGLVPLSLSLSLCAHAGLYINTLLPLPTCARRAAQTETWASAASAAAHMPFAAVLGAWRGVASLPLRIFWKLGGADNTQTHSCFGAAAPPAGSCVALAGGAVLLRLCAHKLASCRMTPPRFCLHVLRGCMPHATALAPRAAWPIEPAVQRRACHRRGAGSVCSCSVRARACAAACPAGRA